MLLFIRTRLVSVMIHRAPDVTGGQLKWPKAICYVDRLDANYDDKRRIAYSKFSTARTLHARQSQKYVCTPTLRLLIVNHENIFQGRRQRLATYSPPSIGLLTWSDC